MPKMLKSRVIYSFSCSGCNASYIRQTARHFKTRVFEHMGISARTSRPLSSPPFSAVHAHCSSAANDLNVQDFPILKCVASNFDLQILESLGIALYKSNLNTQLDSNKLQLF